MLRVAVAARRCILDATQDGVLFVDNLILYPAGGRATGVGTPSRRPLIIRKMPP